MNAQYRYTIITMAIIVVVSMVAASFVVVSQDPCSITTKTTTDDRGKVYLEADHSEFINCGYSDGDQVKLEFSGKEPIYGLFCENKDSVGYFEVYVSNDAKTGKMSLGMKFGNIDKSYAGDVTISFVKHLDRVGKLDHYLNGKIDYSQSKSDDTFCNHREVSVGNIKSSMLYRSTDPLGSNNDGRAYYSDYYAGLANIAHEINLCESASTIEKRIADGSLVSTYCLDLYKNGNVFFKEMSPSLFNNTDKFKACFEYMIANDGPFLIHCMEGKDRTGMYFILLEGMCGATMDEIMKDYMQTMVNFYGIEPGSDEYKTVKSMMFDRIVYFIAHPDEFANCNTINWENVDISGIDINKACKDYVLNEVGMDQSQIDTLVNKLTN